MAMTNQQQTEAYQFFVIAFGAAPGVEYMTQISDAYNAGLTTQQIVNIYTTKAQFTSTYPTFFTSEQFAAALINNVVGSSASAAAKAEAQADIVGALNAGWSRGDVVYQIFTNLAAKDPADPMWGATSTLLANKVAVAKYVTEVQLNGSTDVSVLQGVLAGVTATSDVSTPAKIEAIIAGSGPVVNGNLTVGIDNIMGNVEGQTYTAPIVQNQNGAVTNTLESGDVIAAVGTGNKLVVDLTLTTSGGIPVGPAISAATNNIQVVELRAQSATLDIAATPHGNLSHIDAENFNGVQQWWTVNSRSDIQIEDVRTRPEDTTIGMRNTDPEVGFRVYFDPEQLTNNARAEDSALTLKLDDITKPGDLTDVPVDAVSFKLDGVLYSLKSTAIGAAKTHPELVAALQAAIAAQPALAGLTVTLNANTTITIEDPAGRVFEKGAWGFIDGVVPADGNIVFQQTVGNPSLVDEPITTNVVLDNVGRTSVGGGLDIGSLGEGGVEQFNVSVDRSSWLTEMESTSHLWDDVYAEEQHLEIVNFKSIGAKGDLTVGERAFALANAPDGRVAGGLTDVRVINGNDFAGKLNLGIVLTGDVDARYLAGATAPVQFSFDGSKQNDIFNVEVDSGIAGDPDFRLGINMGAGDDRLILATTGGNGNLNNISVDGGLGNNTFVTATNVGTSANLEFKSFTNFQNYEIEGGSTNHDFTTLNGVTSVVVATAGGANNNLIDLAANNGIVISGKNQTTGNNSNANQFFNTINVEGAEGATLAVKLDNTARIGGVDASGNPVGKLTVADLSVTDDLLTNNLSAVRTLDIESAGRRETTNEITSIKAEKVGTFNFTGTQALTAGLDAAANSTGPAAGVIALKVDATALAAAFTLNVNSTMLNAVDANKTASFKAGDSTKDLLDFSAGINTTAKTSVSGFETVSFHGGQFNAVNTTGVTLYKTDGAAAGLKLTNLQGVENVELGSYKAATTTQPAVNVNGGGAQTFQTNAVSNDSALNLTVKSAFAGGQDINTNGFTTLNLKLDTVADQLGAHKVFDLNLAKVAVDGSGAPVAVTNVGDVLPAVTPGVYAAAAGVEASHFTKANLTNVVVTGGSSVVNSVAGVTDTLDLNVLAPTVKLLDVSGYKGTVTATIGDALTAKIAGVDYTTGNTAVKVGAFGVDLTDVDHQALAVNTITTFVFTTDAAVDSLGVAQKWQIDNFQGINETAAGAGDAGTLSDLSILDLSALGIRGLGDMQISEAVVGGVNVVTIESNTTHNFVIELTGTTEAALDLANFKFAV